MSGGAMESKYRQWDAIAKEEVERVEEEEAAEAAASDRAVGKHKFGTEADPASEHQRRELSKREALKEAKKMWENKRVLEESATCTITGGGGGGGGGEGVGHGGGTSTSATVEDVGAAAGERVVEVDRAYLGDRKILRVDGCEHTTVHVHPSVELVKVFVVGCRHCTLVVSGKVLTSYCEVWDCSDLVLRAQSSLECVQLDRCERISCVYVASALFGSIVTSDVKLLQVSFLDHSAKDASWGDDAEGDDGGADGNGAVPSPGGGATQYIIRMFEVSSSGSIPEVELRKERVIRGIEEYPTTLREAQAENLELRDFEDTPETRAKRADLKKDQGNAFFADGNYGQAIVLYTQALAECATHHVALCNRAACHLKMGDHAAALADAQACVGLSPSFAKAHFRSGLALHALGRHGDAVRAYLTALDLEPHNVQIKDALAIAEHKARRFGNNGTPVGVGVQ